MITFLMAATTDLDDGEFNYKNGFFHACALRQPFTPHWWFQWHPPLHQVLNSSSMLLFTCETHTSSFHMFWFAQTITLRNAAKYFQVAAFVVLIYDHGPCSVSALLFSIMLRLYSSSVDFFWRGNWNRLILRRFANYSLPPLWFPGG